MLLVVGWSVVVVQECFFESVDSPNKVRFVNGPEARSTLIICSLFRFLDKDEGNLVQLPFLSFFVAIVTLVVVAVDTDVVAAEGFRSNASAVCATLP